MVGDAIATKLASLGHEVKMGARDAKNEKAAAWVGKAGAKASQGTFADAATFGEVLFNCTSGMASLEVLKSAGEANLAGKVLIDVSNPLDFSKGMPPTLSVSNTDSLGEQIQRAFPKTHVVKTLNTLNAQLMVEPKTLAGGEHDLFISGNDAGAKGKVKELLQTFGWKTIHDLGDITTARGTESILPIWIRLWGALGDANFNFKIVR
jgi:hypothetical protein